MYTSESKIFLDALSCEECHYPKYFNNELTFDICPICGCKDLYKKKDFNQAIGCLIILIGAILTFFMGFYFTTYTDSQMPIVDSFTTVFSVISTYMVTKKVLGNWLYWIVIDAVSVYLYYSRDLHLTSLLFVVYTIIAIFGYFAWIKKMKHA